MDDTYLVFIGVKATSHKGTFYFNEPGNWIDERGMPIWKKLHRDDGPACEWTDGSKWWWVNGKRHRTDGPACEWTDGSKQWWVNGKRHRTDGPAVEYDDGSKQWWVNGEQLTEKEFNRWQEQYGR